MSIEVYLKRLDMPDSDKLVIAIRDDEGALVAEQSLDYHEGWKFISEIKQRLWKWDSWLKANDGVPPAGREESDGLVTTKTWVEPQLGCWVTKEP